MKQAKPFQCFLRWKAIFLSVTMIVGLLSQAANATIISYDVQNLGGTTWEYSYTVENNTLGSDIEEFSIFFGLGLYENLAVGSTPADWDPLAINPDPFLPDDGFYDALALVTGIVLGDSLSGFSVSFDYLGAGTPGSQFFEVVDPVTLQTLDDGFTISASVPEPGTVLLISVGLIGLIGARNWHRKRAN